jgi:cytochrome P450 monooxygenase
VQPSISLTKETTGASVWRFRGYAEVKQLLVDDRLVTPQSTSDASDWYSNTPVHRVLTRLANSSERHEDTDFDQERDLWRRSMSRLFSQLNIRRVDSYMRTLADELLDDLAGEAGPTDLTSAYSTPFCESVMWALIGLSVDEVRTVSEATVRLSETDDWSPGALKDYFTLMISLVDSRRTSPRDDFLTELVESAADQIGPRYERIARLLAGVLSVGPETPASVIDWGVMLLLTHPSQQRRLLGDMDLMRSAVEEILRLFITPLVAIRGGLERTARTELEVEGVTVSRGDKIFLDLQRANRDPRVFTNPDDFDITRDPNPHLSFGGGRYACNFSKVARALATAGLTALLRAYPGMELAAPPEQLRFKHGLSTGGLVSLPVVLVGS